MTGRFPKLVDSPHYHIWTDALHARALARQAQNQWDRGTYVRWTIITAWIAFEKACADAVNNPRVGYSFQQEMDDALTKLSLPPIDWGRDIWQRVRQIQEFRKDCVHRTPSQEQLFPEATVADHAISTLRNAIVDIYTRTGKHPPAWIQDDDDRGWDHNRGSLGHLTVSEPGVDPQHPTTIRIAYVYKGREYSYMLLRPETDRHHILNRCSGTFVYRLARSVSIEVVHCYRSGL